MTQFKVSNPSELGAIIKAVRKSKYMSQRDLYDKSDVNDHTISRIERTGLCRSDSLFAVLNALGMHIVIEVEPNRMW